MEPTEEQLDRALEWMRSTGEGYKKAATKWAGSTDQGDRARFVQALKEQHKREALARGRDGARAGSRASTGAPARGTPEEEEREPTLVEWLLEDLDVAQLVLDQIKGQIQDGDELPGRTIAAMGTLVKTIGGLKERITQLREQQPRGPQTEEEALTMLRVSMEDWEDAALECAMDVYQERHRCRLTVEGEWGHQATRTDGRWDLVREVS